jgi:hypothetical protein
LPTSAAEAVPIKHAITGHNYTWSLLWFGALPNSNTQLIQYTCWLPTLEDKVDVLEHPMKAEEKKIKEV